MDRLPARRRGIVLSVGVAILLGCPTPLGGWNVDDLLRAEPGLAGMDIGGLDDLVPYPAPVIEIDATAEAPPALELIVCRWPTGSRIPVRLELTGARQDWARLAIGSLSRGLSAVDFEVVAAATRPATSAEVQAPAVEARFQGIEILEVASEAEDGPGGVGDTRVGCPVASRDSERFGRLHHAEIRMRAVVVDALDRSVPIAAEDWTGALMHELAHALGFQGHVRSVDSILVLEQDRLRKAGRRALAGEAWSDHVLEALYRIEVGRPLGRRELSHATGRWLRDLYDRRGSSPGGPVAPVARVGDRHAELVWTTNAGVALPLRFPHWPHQLRSGAPLVGVPIGEARL